VCLWVLTCACARQTTTTKGTGGDIIILEEAAYVDPQFFYETVAPLLCVGTTTLIGISTLTSEINFYSEFALVSVHFTADSLTFSFSSASGPAEGQADRTAYVHRTPDPTSMREV
jgi:hypothetical protein